MVRTIIQVVEIVGALVSRGLAEPSGGLRRRRRLADQFGLRDRYVLQINARYWKITAAINSVTPASLDCHSVCRSEQSEANRQRTSRQLPLLQKLATVGIP